MNASATSEPATSSSNRTPGQIRIDALVGEVWMLVDYIAGSPEKGMNKIEFKGVSDPGTKSTARQLLDQVSEIEQRSSAENGSQLLVTDHASMQLARDTLTLLTWPASGLTIAYTTLVTGSLRLREASRVILAEQAYGKLRGQARWHTVLQFFIVIATVIVMGLAVWHSAKVALGKALLQNLDKLMVQQAGLNTEKLNLELRLALGATNKVSLLQTLDIAASREGVPLGFYRLCDRSLVIKDRGSAKPWNSAFNYPIFETAEESDICGREDVLRTNLEIVRQNLKIYNQNWPGMVGSGFSRVRNLVTWISNDQYPLDLDSVGRHHDIEFKIAPVLLVWGNFVLPVIFGFLGSAIFVLLDNYTKMRASTLHPRDTRLALVRLVLGLVVGACVGLFFSTNGSAPQSGVPSASALVASLTLTASGVAFLAGFGVETVFSLLEALIKKVFSLPSQERPQQL